MAKRRGVLRPGDRVRFDGTVRTVVGVSGTVVLLADERAETMAIRLGRVLKDRQRLVWSRLDLGGVSDVEIRRGLR